MTEYFKKPLPPVIEAALKGGKLSEREVGKLRKYGYNVDGTEQKPIPNMFVRGISFTWAMMQWGWGGFEHRSPEEIETILKICDGCALFKDEKCSACGCHCNSKQTFLNKLYLKTSTCPHPDGPKWT